MTWTLDKYVHEQITLLLIGHGADLHMLNNKSHDSLLHKLVEDCSYKDYNSVEAKIKFLHSHGYNINITNRDSKTALYLACENTTLSSNNINALVQLLLSLGADPLICDKQRLYPLHMAVMTLKGTAVGMLLKAMEHYHVDVVDQKNRTPLYLAVHIQDPKLVHMLLKAGATDTVSARSLAEQKKSQAQSPEKQAVADRILAEILEAEKTLNVAEVNKPSNVKKVAKMFIDAFNAWKSGKATTLPFVLKLEDIQLQEQLNVPTIKGIIVYRGVWHGLSLVVKEITLTEGVAEEIYQREVEILKILGNHENVVRFLGFQTQETLEACQKIFIFLEYFPCSLADLITKYRKSPGAPSEAVIKHIFLQTAKGLDFIQSKLVIYRDVKPDNILVVTDKMGSVGRVAITDFDASKQMESGNSYVASDIGTRPYRAPEVGRSIYSFAADVFSLGITIYQLMTLKFEYQLRPPNFTGLDTAYPTIAKLVQQCVDDDPAKRPTTTQLIKELQRVATSNNSNTNGPYYNTTCCS